MALLSETLERFNRKERNLAVRHILGHVKRPPPLDRGFCHKVCCKLNLNENMLDEAWWATDYHISWLAGALAIHARGNFAEERTWPNQAVPPICSRRIAKDKTAVERQIAEGNQEDIDLVIAVENHLILIEIKAYGRWDMVQLESKLTRIKLIKAFYQEIKEKNKENILFHILLLSPQDLPLEKRERLRSTLKLAKLNLPWIQLCLPLCESEIREVGRCDRQGYRREQIPSTESRWGIYELNKKRPRRLASAAPNADTCSIEAAALGTSVQSVEL